MGQQEVYDFLKQHKSGWFTARDISTEIGTSIGSVTMCLKRLRETFFVDFKHKYNAMNKSKAMNKGANPYVYRIK